MLAADATLLPAIAPEIEFVAQAIEVIAGRVAGGGRCFMVGAGSSGRLAMIEAAEMPATFGLPADVWIAILAGHPSLAGADRLLTDDSVEDDIAAGADSMDAAGVSGRDAVLAISASGRTPFTVSAIREAATRHAATIALVCDRPSPLAAAADIAIQPVTGPEVLSGSTRLRAGTAQKIILDMVTTGAMARLGRVHGDRMIDVLTTNEKLRRRAVTIVAETARASTEESLNALELVGWSARAAILLLTLDVPPEAASKLATTHRFLRDALDAGSRRTSQGPTP